MAGKVAARFLADIRANAVNRAILGRLPALGLPDAWLVAGCPFQATWNLRAGRRLALPTRGAISNYLGDQGHEK